MIFHLASVDKFRVDTIEEVDNFHDALREDADNQGYELDNFKYTKKVRKQQGEIVDEYYVVEARKIFQDAKEPFREFKSIEYNRTTNPADVVPFMEV